MIGDQLEAAACAEASAYARFGMTISFTCAAARCILGIDEHGA